MSGRDERGQGAASNQSSSFSSSPTSSLSPSTSFPSSPSSPTTSQSSSVEVCGKVAIAQIHELLSLFGQRDEQAAAVAQCLWTSDADHEDEYDLAAGPGTKTGRQGKT